MFLLKNNQAFNIFANKDAEKNEVQGSGNKAYIQFSVAAWNANKNTDGSYKKKGDSGYEVPVFATAFGKTAQKISEALKGAVVEAGEGEFAKVAFKTGKGCYVKKTEHVSDKGTAYYENYIFGNVEVMDLKDKQKEGTDADKSVPVGDDNAQEEGADADKGVPVGADDEGKNPASKNKPAM